MALSFVLTGCGGSDTSNQRQLKSNPFAPSAHSNNNRAPSRPQTPKVAQKKEQPKESPRTASPVTPKVMAQKKPVPVESKPSNPTNIISETSKRTLDKENPGVAIIVRGINGNEPKALSIIQNELRASFAKAPTADLAKRKPLVESAENDIEHFIFNKQLVLVVRPAPTDLFGFAQNLKWGKVKEIDIPNRIITVDTQLKELTALTAQANATTPSESPGTGTAKADSLNGNQNTNPAKPAMKKPENKSGSDLPPILVPA